MDGEKNDLEGKLDKMGQWEKVGKEAGLKLKMSGLKLFRPRGRRMSEQQYLYSSEGSNSFLIKAECIWMCLEDVLRAWEIVIDEEPEENLGGEETYLIFVQRINQAGKVGYVWGIALEY